MAFNQLICLFAFLPVSIILYRFMPQKFRTAYLVLVSFLFYAWGTPLNLLYLAVSIAFNYLTGLELQMLQDAGEEKKYRLILITGTAADLILLAFFKYGTGQLPVGISFYTFSVLSYLFDIHQRKARAQENILKFALYVSFFPKLTSGPIVQYRDMEAQIGNARLTRAGFFSGAQLFLTGLMKKVILADHLGEAFRAVTAGGKLSVLSAWLGMIFYSLQLYFDFSGYSDMAIGLGRIFGFRFAENFHYPYLSKNISEFWRRWHISLGAWFRNYVYIPLGGNRVPGGRLFLNLLIVWLLTGIWHGNTWNFVIWGLYHGAFVILERFVIRKRFDGIPDWIRILATDLIVFIGWIFFFTPDIGESFEYIGQLFGTGRLGFAGGGAWYFFRNYFWLLAAAILCCGSMLKRLWYRIFYLNILGISEKALNAVSAVLTAVLLLFAISGMVSNTYSTFLYFQF